MRALTTSVLVGLVALTAGSASAQPDERLPPPSNAKTIVTGFDPALDGLSYKNAGSYATPNGDCFGMSLASILRFKARKAGAPRAEDELQERALAGAIQNRYLTEFHRGLKERLVAGLFPVDDKRAGQRIFDQLAKGAPVAVHLQYEEAAHVVVFFGYDGKSFLIYDPDAPGETKKWAFEPGKGFSTFSRLFAWAEVKSLGPYDPADLAAMETLHDLDTLRDSCDALDATCAAPYMNVSAGVATRSLGRDGTAVVFSATVSGGLSADPDGRPAERAKSVAVFVNGQTAGTVSLDRDGRTGEVAIDKSLFTKDQNDVRVVVSASGSRLAGFRAFEAAPPSKTKGLLGALGSSP